MIWFIVGLILGGSVGFVTAAVLARAGEEDKTMMAELHNLEDARTFTWWQE